MDFINNQYLLLSIVVICSTLIILFIVIKDHNRTKRYHKHTEEIINCQRELQNMLEKVLNENDDFFIILDEFTKSFNAIIRRQGKIGAILYSISSEMRKHDKKVAFLLEKLGESFPDDYKNSSS